jgi:hypothetical protein
MLRLAAAAQGTRLQEIAGAIFSLRFVLRSICAVGSRIVLTRAERSPRGPKREVLS